MSASLKEDVLKAVRESSNNLKPCCMRHKQNGNCVPSGGFCTAVNKPICEALHNAYRMGVDDTVKELAEFVTKKNWDRRLNND